MCNSILRAGGGLSPLDQEDVRVLPYSPCPGTWWCWPWSLCPPFLRQALASRHRHWTSGRQHLVHVMNLNCLQSFENNYFRLVHIQSIIFFLQCCYTIVYYILLSSHSKLLYNALMNKDRHFDQYNSQDENYCAKAMEKSFNTEMLPE